jgi:hypothetical protein
MAFVSNYLTNIEQLLHYFGQRQMTDDDMEIMNTEDEGYE